MIPINLNLILTRMKALPSGTHFDDYSEIETFLINKYKKDKEKFFYILPLIHKSDYGSDALLVSKAGCFAKGVYFDNFLLAKRLKIKRE